MCGRDHRVQPVSAEDQQGLTEWLAAVRRRLTDATILLFGSRARGDAREDSDFDLCIVSAAFAGLKPWERSLLAVELWDLPYAVDVVGYTPEEWKRLASWTFPARIREEGIVLAA